MFNVGKFVNNEMGILNKNKIVSLLVWGYYYPQVLIVVIFVNFSCVCVSRLCWCTVDVTSSAVYPMEPWFFKLFSGCFACMGVVICWRAVPGSV